MKKIFYILASAIVALGAVACENEGMENIAPEVNGDTVSFVANIDNTKTDLDGLQTIWTAGDEITVVWNEKEYTFENTAEKLNTFSCTAEGLSAIVGQPVEAWYNKEGVDSSAGTAGAQLYATGSFGELSFQIQSAFLKFTTTEEVVLAGEGLFNNAKASYTGTDVYVAVNAGVKTTLHYTIDGVAQKATYLNTEAGKIYNLGTLAVTKATELTLNPGVWADGGAWFAAYFFGNGDKWVKMSDSNSDGIYEVAIPTDKTYPNVIFVRMNSADTETLSWDNKWDQTNDLTVPADNLKSRFTVTAWGWGNKCEGDWTAKNVILYLVPGDWNVDGARYAAYFYNDSTSKNEWVNLTDAGEDGVYEVAIPTKNTYPNIIFGRMDGETTENNWDNKWNQTGNLTIDYFGNNLYTITGWGESDGNWSTK